MTIAAHRISPKLALCAVTLCGALSLAQAPTPKLDPQKAEDAYDAGARLLNQHDVAAAEQQFQRATELNPKRSEYSLALTIARNQHISDLVQKAAQARLASHTAEANSLLAQARAIDPNNELVLQHQAYSPNSPQPGAATQAQIHHNVEFSIAPPIEIAPDRGSHDLHFRGDVKQVVQQVAQTYGIRTVLDDSVTAQELRFDLDDVTYAQAMPILLQIAHLMATAIDGKTLLIAKDTEDNRAKFERLVQETIYVPGLTNEQMNELSNIVKNVFDVKQIVATPGSGMLAIRAPGPTLKAVNYTLADLLDGGSQVMLDIKVLSVDKSYMQNLGISPPTSAGALSVTQEAQSLVSANSSIIQSAISSGAFVPTGNTTTDLLTEAAYLILTGLATDAKLSNLFAIAGNGLTLTGFYLGGGATLNVALNESDTRALDDISVQVQDTQTATLRVGEKYPITVGTYSTGVSSSTSSALSGVTINGVSASSLLNQFLGSTAASVVPQIQYEDLGITLKTTPFVEKSGLIRVNVDFKIEALTGASLDNIPILTTSNFVSSITMPEGSTSVMIAQLTNTQSAAVTGFPGLGSLPGFQDSLSETVRERDKSEVIVLVTPHLTRRRPFTIASRRIPFNNGVAADN
jgi:general secretion pathway protein D